MRLLFFILILANASTLAYFMYHDQGTQSVKSAHAPLRAEQIRTLKPDANDTKNAVEKLSCWIWSINKADEVAPARSALEKLGLNERLSEGPQEVYMLSIEGLKTKREAEKKLAELKALGINEGEIQEGSDKAMHVSLGSFPDEDSATVRLNQLKEKGVRSTTVAKQAGPGTRFAIKQANQKTATDLAQVAGGFAGTELKAATCPAAST